MLKFKTGDRVRMVANTMFWGGNPQLRGKVGVVTSVVQIAGDIVAVDFPGEEPITTSAGQFELAD